MTQKGSHAHTQGASGFVTHSSLRQAGILPFPGTLPKTTQVPLIFLSYKEFFSIFLSAGIFNFWLSTHSCSCCHQYPLLEGAKFALMFDPSYSSGRSISFINIWAFTQFQEYLKTFQYWVQDTVTYYTLQVSCLWTLQLSDLAKSDKLYSGNFS